MTFGIGKMVAILDFTPHAFSTPGIYGDFMHLYSGDVKEPSLKNSAFCIFFPQVPSVLVPNNAPGLYSLMKNINYKVLSRILE